MLAVLGMYPFAHLQGAYDSLWAGVRSRLVDGPDALDHDIDLHTSWTCDDLLLGQTCGWPLVTALDGVVEVVGRFDMAVPFAHDGEYRTVLVASKPLGVEEWRRDPDAVCAVNSTDSLSGWVSLQWAWGAAPPQLLMTGAHVESVRAVADGRAHLASIDAVSFEHVCRSAPALAGRVHVVGHGPSVPTLPLITAPAFAARVGELRDAIEGALADPSLAGVVRELRIRGFVPCDARAYAGLAALLPAR